MELKLMYLYNVSASYIFSGAEISYVGLVLAENADIAKLKFERTLRITDNECNELAISKIKGEVYILRR